jgi:hypothetical protein
MKPEPDMQVHGETPHQRFVELGKRIMAVPKTEVDSREKTWKAKRKRKSRTKRR